ncbi:hypothetical protein J7K97_06000, partial [Candidatus Aerophobetes bacterium]|nr:hypothetical protein [Candidatus Aerophobetes bacterium]
MTKKKILILLLITFLAIFAVNAGSFHLTFSQKLSLIIFIIIVIATLALWKFHLPVAFLGVGAFLLTKTLDISHFIAFAKYTCGFSFSRFSTLVFSSNAVVSCSREC